ncbi:MAG: helix-turn-helix domain-containing protein [Acidobacteriota bacterium]|nr:helix-turn-helix domain-containing protein [Acidobacteriota bacterium]
MTAQQKFGDALRRRREQRGISLKELAHRTKISASLLAGMERGDCSRWPGGIYSRAWVREYASAIGLDAEQVAARFTTCFAHVAFPDGTPEAAEAAERAAAERRSRWRVLLPGWTWRPLQ